MAFFTKQSFRNVANQRVGFKNLTNILSESRYESSYGKITSIFLSHCHTDKDLIGETVAFFKGLNIDLYVDWMDDTMPNKTSGETAKKIKNKIITTKRFILIATNDAVSSKWCNWELGIGDTYRLLTDKIAVLPLADNSGNWTGNEYLQIYPHIEPVPSHDTIYKIFYPDGSYKWLDDWLKS